MRFSIAAKLGLSAAALVLLVTGLTGYVCYLEAKGTLVEHDLTGMQEEANQIGRQFLEDLDRLRTQALFVSNLPSARSLLERPTDEPEKARENLHFIANQLLENRARSHHLSISLIRLTDGEELFRLQRPEAGKPIEPESRTQRWGQAREFDKLGDLAPTAVLVTDAERREYGPGREYLEMRSLAPVRLSTKGKPVGAIILRMDLSSLLARYAASPRHLVFVTDRDRRFLFHPDQLTGGKVPDGLTAEPLLDGADWLRQPPEPKQVGLVTPADWKPVPHDLGDRSYWLLVSKAIESPDLKGAIEKAWEEQRAAHRAVVFEPLDPARPMRLRLAARDWGELTAIRGALDAAAGPARPGAELTSRLGWEESH
jgi:hypothetical protein